MASTNHLVYRGDRLVLLDQRKLPGEEVYVACTGADDTAAAIRDMVVRGAPAIGCAAAFGLALEAKRLAAGNVSDFPPAFAAAAERLAAARPTAVNLRWAVERILRAVGKLPPAEAARAAEAEATRIHQEDLAACRAIGAYGAALVPDVARILTHCNAGALATAGHGTALGVIRSAVEAGKKVRVLADETRPYLQGARLTAYELSRDGIHVEVIPDVAAGHLISRGEVDLAVVGADRIAANGDTANKIGTYTVAVLCHEHGVPFYVAAPTSTVDLATPDGAHIPIEERSAEEVTRLYGLQLAPAGVGARHPAFDVTPARLVTAIVTERGVARAPYAESLARLVRGE
jgi:methylthioribose-1-phosphate isomerase